MSTMTLEPCPFCGGEPEIVRAQDEDGRFAAVGCPHCGAGSKQHYFVGDDAVPHVVGAWNKRAQPAQAVDVKPCAYCGATDPVNWVSPAPDKEGQS